MTWWGWALMAFAVGCAGLCYAILWIEKVPDNDWPRRWR